MDLASAWSRGHQMLVRRNAHRGPRPSRWDNGKGVGRDERHARVKLGAPSFAEKQRRCRERWTGYQAAHRKRKAVRCGERA
jgi:hypothetical protein